MKNLVFHMYVIYIHTFQFYEKSVDIKFLDKNKRINLGKIYLDNI